MSGGLHDCKVSLSGSVRWFWLEAQQELRKRLQTQIDGIAQSYRIRIALDYQARYPAVVNDGPSADLAACAATDVAGIAKVATEFPPFVGSDNFAFMLGAQKGAYVVTVNGVESGLLHLPAYDFNDDAIFHGGGFWVARCRRFMHDTQGENAA